MPLFQHQNKTLHYDLIPGLLPEDTLFIHGNLASNRWWEPAREEFKRRYGANRQPGHMVMMEWLGCGDSSGPQNQEDLDMRNLGHDLVQLVRGVGLSDVNLVGHSTGGLIALCAILEAPELFRRVVLLDSVSASGLSFDQSMYDAFTKMSQDKVFCDQIMASTIHNVNLKDPLIQGLMDDAFRVHPRIWHGIPDSLKTINIFRELKKIPHPVLVLHGEHDQLLPMKESQTMAAELPKGQFLEIKGQGHCCNVENPSLFVDLVDDFLFSEEA